MKVLSYLYETRELRLCYEDNGIEGNKVFTFTDSGEQFIVDNRGKRTTGIATFYNQNLIYWCTRTQSVATGDICESELFALQYRSTSIVDV